MNGFVAFLDVLGFSESILKHDDLGRLDTYRDLIAEGLGRFKKLEHVMFSDNILISTRTDVWDDFDSIVRCVSSLLYSFTEEGIPL